MMKTTLFSFMMALLWFNFYIVLISFLRRNNKFILSFSVFPLLLFTGLSIVRLIINIDNPNAYIIKSSNIFTNLYDFLSKTITIYQIEIKIYQILVSIWMIVALYLLYKLFKFQYLYSKYLHKIPKYECDRYNKIKNDILQKSKINKDIKIYISDKITNPLIIGFVNVSIFLPNIDLDDSQIYYILAHEITHFKKLDIWKKFFVQCLKIVFWWNPFIYIFSRDFNQLLEIQCDLQTVEEYSEEEKINYLKTITYIAKSARDRETEKCENYAASYFISEDEGDYLIQRYRLVLGYQSKHNAFRIFNIFICIIGIILFISSYFIIVQPEYYPENVEDFFTIEDENVNYIIKNKDGEYDVYIDSIYVYTTETLDDERLKDFTFVFEEVEYERES